MAQSNRLKNVARGGGSYNTHRLEIVRDILERPSAPIEALSAFLRARLYSVDAARTVFAFIDKDWDLCARLLSTESGLVEDRMLELVIEHAITNHESIQRLYTYGDALTRRLLQRDDAEVVEEDVLTPEDSQSLFALRVKCGQNQNSTDDMRRILRAALPSGWAKASLISPLVYHFSHRPPASILDNFLSYIVTGQEHSAEKLALKLLLSDEAAREASLAFKVYVGLMGHPFDAIEMVLDHVELRLVEPTPLASHLKEFLANIAELFPDSRGARLNALATGQLTFSVGTDSTGLSCSLGLEDLESERYAAICDLAPLPDNARSADAKRPYAILSNMRACEYPNPGEFQLVVAEKQVWFFLEAGRFLEALLRSIYMIERADRDLEARSVLRLISFLGFVNPFVASMPSGMHALRALATQGATSVAEVDAIERETNDAIEMESPFSDRLWINELQWHLRRLEEQGRVAEWLSHVRKNTKVRPSYLTGINWHWVEEIIQLQRLKPFKSFDGAYLFLHMELEAGADPMRLRIVLEPLIRDLPFKNMVSALIKEFGTAAPVMIRRHLTTQNQLASGMAPNYVAALDQRVRAFEACIKELGFGPLLTEQIYDSEVRTLTSELLLTSVNTGKFEIPWDTYRKDSLEAQQDLFLAFESLRPHLEEVGQLSALFENTVSFTNGRTQTYKIRRRDGPIFALVTALILGFMQHPAFGLEVILSGRFRHNNLVQEIWTALAAVDSAVIPSVPGPVQSALIAEYTQASERVIDDWCSEFMQTRRSDKPRGMFNLVPDQKELDELLTSASGHASLPEIIEEVIVWIKDKLRAQVADARKQFLEDATARLTTSFAQVRDTELASDKYRPQDVPKVHTAVCDAVIRRMNDLQNWFDGVDTISAGPISLADLSLAAETLFVNMMPDRSLTAQADEEAKSVLFEPFEVKIAFDLLREVYFNALKFGRGPDVELVVGRTSQDAGIAYRFSNAACDNDSELDDEIRGSRYLEPNDGLFREGNSGLTKIAASSATLIGRDSIVRRMRLNGVYQLTVPLRADSDAEEAA